MVKKTDVLTQKQSELNAYVDQAKAAISLVTDTIARLSDINENIDAKIREIDEYSAGLAATKSGLTNAKTKNERILKNFNALLDNEVK